MNQRRNLVDNQYALSVRKQCELLSVHRSGLYYAPKGESSENLEIMRLMAIYPKKNLSKLGLKKYIHPYLLKRLKIERPNQVWAIDITYIPMKDGFMYLTAIIDVYSRYIVGWGISNSLEAKASLSVLEQAIRDNGKPEIINSDQGSQFTCEDWVKYLKEEGIKISMDGKGRAIDNIFIERFWRTLKYDHVYMHPASDGLELYQGIKCICRVFCPL